jgi:hypothetical protein
MKRILVFLWLILLAGCHAPTERSTTPWPGMAKIKFPLDDIHPDGLRGPTSGLVAVSYEFCVPTSDIAHRDVQQLDPTLQIYSGSPGRVGCTTNQTLAIGNTHQPQWREVLQALSSLTYVSEIRESYFE